MTRFNFIQTPLAGLQLVQRQLIEDSRGFLSRLYCTEEFKATGAFPSIAQLNHTLTRRKGTVRGMHYQRHPHAESKLVSCLRGEIFDMAVDLRRNSPTFLKWHGEILSAKNQRSLLIPKGFAHGFQALTDNCEVIYLHSAGYQPAAEDAVNINDPRLSLVLPLEITEMSERDRAHPLLTSGFKGIEA